MCLTKPSPLRPSRSLADTFLPYIYLYLGFGTRCSLCKVLFEVRKQDTDSRLRLLAREGLANYPQVEILSLEVECGVRPLGVERCWVPMLPSETGMAFEVSTWPCSCPAIAIRTEGGLSVQPFSLVSWPLLSLWW